MKYLPFVSSFVLGASLFAVAETDQFYPDSLPPFTGQYDGTRILDDGTFEPMVGQVIPLGEDRYETRLRPSLGTDARSHVILRGSVKEADMRFPPTMGIGKDTVLQVTSHGVLVAASLYEVYARGVVLNGAFAGYETGQFALEKVPFEPSPTLGQAPPKGALVLFDGSSFQGWHHKDGQESQWSLTDGAMRVVPTTSSLISDHEFGDARIHLEFRTPYMPEQWEQKRGNSGVYLHGRYEVQVLDSFGLEGEWNECGGIYKVARPLLNMAYPPTYWQTYDITFTAPKFNAAGEKITNARITVLHNGVVIHDNLELPDHTGGSIEENEVPVGPLMLQHHNDPVEYRNIWLVE